MSTFKQYLQKLIRTARNKNLHKVGSVYLVSAWLIIQVVVTIFPQFDMPPWLTRATIVVLAIGFPISLIVTWFQPQATADSEQSDAATTDDKDAPWFGSTTVGLLIGLLLVVGATLVVSSLDLGKAAEAADNSLLEKPVAVTAFQNKTVDPTLNAFGLMAKDWISQGLMESRRVHVIKPEATAIFTGQTTQNAEVIPTGAEVVIRGRYYQEDEDRLIVTAEIVERATEKVIYVLPPITGPRENLSALLTTVQQKLLGFYNLGDEYLGKSPPRYDAYSTYSRALDLGLHPPTEKIALLREAHRLDPDFIDPLFSLYAVSTWGADHALQDSVLRAIKNSEHKLSDYQHLLWQIIQLKQKGDEHSLPALHWQMYEQYGIDWHALFAMGEYRSLNNLEKVVELYQRFDPIQPPEDDEILTNYVGALYDLGRYEEVLEAIRNYHTPIIAFDNVLAQLSSLARLSKWEAFDEQLTYYKTQPVHMHFTGFYSPSVLLGRLCQDLWLMNEHEKLPKYLDILETWLEEDDPNKILYGAFAAYYHCFRGDYQQAYELGKDPWQKQNMPLFEEIPGVCLAKLNRWSEVDSYLDSLANRNSLYYGADTYAMAVIESYRDREKGMRLLRKAFQAGFEFDFHSYHNDHLLVEAMGDYPPFWEFVQPK